MDAWYESPTGLQQVAGLGGPFGAAINQPAQLSNNIHHHHHRNINSHLQRDQTTYDLYKKQLIIQHSMRGWLQVKNEWTSGVHKTDQASLAYSYRVTCQANYFGDQCNILCRPRDDVYGHFTCSQQGEVLCLPGWQGKYCEEPICLPGCHKDQGNCSRPNECNCRFGWQGPSCEQCVRYPGCVHGTCNRPHECICEEGWGGLLCNEDLNYCANHQPCKNGALCTNSFDLSGEGSYTCTCEEGFTGKDCDRRIVPALGTHQRQDLLASQAQASPPPSPLSNNSSSVASQTASLSSQAARPAQQQVAAGAATAGSQQANSKTTSSKSPSMPPLSSPRFLLPVGPTMAAEATQTAALDHRVIVAYGVIIVCMVILVVLLLLRMFFERLSGAVVGCGQLLTGSTSSIWSAGHLPVGHPHSRRSHHSRRHRQASSQAAEDVATLQNHQNIYKSRTSLSTDKIPFGDVADNSDACSSASSSLTDDCNHDDLHHHHHHHHHQLHLRHHNQSTLPTSSRSRSRSGQRHQHHRHQYYSTGGSRSQQQLHGSHSVHNLYGHLPHHAHFQPAPMGPNQPPPPPYTISSSHLAGPTYAGAGSTTYATGSAIYHPASLVALAPGGHPIYTNHSTYGTAAASTSALAPTRKTAAGGQASSTAVSQSPAAEQSCGQVSDSSATSAPTSAPTTATVATTNDSTTTLTSSSLATTGTTTTTSNANPYGSSTNGSNSTYQSPYYVMCYHIL